MPTTTAPADYLRTMAPAHAPRLDAPPGPLIPLGGAISSGQVTGGIVAEESDGSIAWFPRLVRNRQATLETTNATTTATTVPHDIVAKTAAAAAKPLYVCLET